MSHSKKDRVFPNKPTLVTEEKLAQMIAAALRHDYGGVSSPIKHIGMQTGISLRAIKNWFQARHTPSSSHLLVLAGISPSIMRLILEQAAEKELLEAFEALRKKHPAAGNSANNVPINVPIKSGAANHNKRQLWFLNRLHKDLRTTAHHIQVNCKVTLKTARRDIAALKKQGLIHFTGARKTGHYTLTENR